MFHEPQRLLGLPPQFGQSFGWIAGGKERLILRRQQCPRAFGRGVRPKGCGVLRRALGCIDPSDPVVDVEIEITQEAADTLLGMTEDDAMKMAANNGWGVRVGQRDDEMFALTEDYRLDRVTLTIVADEVTKVDVG